MSILLFITLQVTVGIGKARAYTFKKDLKIREHIDHCNDAQKALDSGKVSLEMIVIFA